MKKTILIMFATFIPLLIVLIGCEETHRAKKVPRTGFLDYSQLRPGGKDEALLIYQNPTANFSKYNKVIFNNVSVWRGQESKLHNVSQEDLNRLAYLLRVKVLAALSSDYGVAYEPGPGVMLIEAAITEAQESNRAMDKLTTILPPALIASQVKRLTSGTHAFVGKAGIEGKITDSQTGELLVAAADRRAGGKGLKGTASSWDDVEKVYEHWGKRLSQRLRRLRARPPGVGTEASKPTKGPGTPPPLPPSIRPSF